MRRPMGSADAAGALSDDDGGGGVATMVAQSMNRRALETAKSEYAQRRDAVADDRRP